MKKDDLWWWWWCGKGVFWVFCDTNPSSMLSQPHNYYTLPLWSVGLLGIHCMWIYIPYVFSLLLLFYYPTSCYIFISCLYHLFFYQQKLTANALLLSHTAIHSPPSNTQKSKNWRACLPKNAIDEHYTFAYDCKHANKLLLSKTDLWCHYSLGSNCINSMH